MYGAIFESSNHSDLLPTTKMLSSCHKKVANPSKDGRNNTRLKYHMGYQYLASCKKVVSDINK